MNKGTIVEFKVICVANCSSGAVISHLLERTARGIGARHEPQDVS